MEPALRTTLRVADGGRIVIPAAVRQRLGMEVGSDVILTVEDGHAILMNAKSARRNARQRVRRYVPPNVSLSKELMAERKADARRENVNIIDASAILAYLQSEKGQDAVENALDAGPSWVSAVNYCEVLSKLCENGMPAVEAQAAVEDLGLTVIDFDVDLARHAAAIRVRTMPIGASLGDRACLALARRTAQTQTTPVVYTAEQAWTRLKWPFKVVLIRSASGGQ